MRQQHGETVRIDLPSSIHYCQAPTLRNDYLASHSDASYAGMSAALARDTDAGLALSRRPTESTKGRIDPIGSPPTRLEAPDGPSCPLNA